MFPAGAGMNRFRSIALSESSDVPRRRGDEPASRLLNPTSTPCSPHTRG